MFSCSKLARNVRFARFGINGNIKKFAYPSRTYQTVNGVFGHAPPAEKPSLQLVEEKVEWRAQNPNLFRLIEAYRQHGHKNAAVDPLGISKPKAVPELNINLYRLHASDIHHVKGWLENVDLSPSVTTEEVVRFLQETYCGQIAAEFEHLESLEEREWWSQQMESWQSQPVSAESRQQACVTMLKAQAFDHFVAAKFPTVKRYGGEGAESCTAFLMELFRLSPKSQVEEIVMCMAHRGRLNLLTDILNFQTQTVFRKMKGLSEFPANVNEIGDVLSHLFVSSKVTVPEGDVQVTLLPNPSHLEAVNPVAVGRARGRLWARREGPYNPEPEAESHVLCLQVHGDAAVAGQGVVHETLALAQVPHFTVQGSLHLVVNNQVGFTTPAERGRSSRYCTDVGKIIGAPVLHINGDNVDAVLQGAKMALAYQRRFRKDVFVDVVCYRKWGHNELDDPTFTNPIMYLQGVHVQKETVPERYLAKLSQEGVVSEADVHDQVQKHVEYLGQCFKEAETFVPPLPNLQEGEWKKLTSGGAQVTTWDTGVDSQLLQYLGARSVAIPEGFALHPQLQKSHVDARLAKLKEGKFFDWGTAEALAMASLLSQGFSVRICGQDVGRATFSHRHAMVVDQKTGGIYIPLNNLNMPSEVEVGHLEVANSLLSEEAVLGFEYGYSIESPKLLNIWEAQFGDFFNGAQIMIDTFLSSGEAKWMLQSGLVVLLPHGFDGAGPEHSSCRIERWLQLTDSQEDKIDGDSVNFSFVNPTTSAQYFHLLRRQMLRNFRKPLVVASPKTLLRLSAASSSLGELGPGTHFHPVLDDAQANTAQVKRVIFVSGKHYYALEDQRKSQNLTDVAIVRVEELAPFPAAALQKIADKYKSAKDFIWSQEEPQNAGAWSFVQPRFENLVGIKLRYVGRPTLPLPAVGIGSVHKKQAQYVVTQPFA